MDYNFFNSIPWIEGPVFVDKDLILLGYDVVLKVGSLEFFSTLGSIIIHPNTVTTPQPLVGDITINGIVSIRDFMQKGWTVTISGSALNDGTYSVMGESCCPNTGSVALVGDFTPEIFSPFVTYVINRYGGFSYNLSALETNTIPECSTYTTRLVNGVTNVEVVEYGMIKTFDL